ncbi:redoxin domain-containing protein [Bacillus timonensis]|nr:redoxin domain-containing protein [Bacillus timonensis]
MYRIIYILGIVALIIYFSVTQGSASEQDSIEVSKAQSEIGIREGDKAPDFLLKTLDGKDMKLSDFAGKKVILNFFATWCPPCKEEVPHMQEFYSKKDGNVEILAVNLATAERSSKAIYQFVEDFNITFPVVLDQRGDVGNTYQAHAIPTTYIIDSNGIIRKRMIGPMDVPMMDAWIKGIQ